MPLGANSKSIVICNGVIEKCEVNKLESQYLSRGGKLTLANSVIHALLAYMMSIFLVLANVIKRYDRVRRNFFLKGTENKNKFHLVKWEELTVGKEVGGVGMRNMKLQNQSLMMKWLWKF